MSSIHTISAGGILFRKIENAYHIVIVERVRNVEKKWGNVLRQLPKGHCHPGEPIEETALREVYEETGFKARIVKKAGSANWAYERNGKHWIETVYYFLMEPISLIQHDHDNEFDFVKWIRIEEAGTVLSYPEERELLISLINDGRLFQE